MGHVGSRGSDAAGGPRRPPRGPRRIGPPQGSKRGSRHCFGPRRRDPRNRMVPHRVFFRSSAMRGRSPVQPQLVREAARGVASGNLGTTPSPLASQRLAVPRPRHACRCVDGDPGRPALGGHRVQSTSSPPRPSEHAGDNPSAGQFRPDGQIGSRPIVRAPITCARWPQSSTRRCPLPQPSSPSRRAGSAAPSWVRCGRRSPGRPGGCPQTAGRPR